MKEQKQMGELFNFMLIFKCVEKVNCVSYLKEYFHSHKCPAELRVAVKLQEKHIKAHERDPLTPL